MKLFAMMCLSAMVLLVLSCCSLPIHKRDSFDDKTGVQTLSIDAKQRLVIIAKRPDSDPAVAAALAKAGTVGHRGDPGFLPITCAEPSPDALSALSTSAGGSVTDPKVAANFAAAQVESAASIGLRTQSIQLLRDGMYRLCEQYAAGGMNGSEWVREQRRYQNLMLSLLAIEQLTGAVTPRQVGLGGGTASASVGDKADEAAGNLAKANSDVTSAQSTLKKAQDTQASDQKACAADKTSSTCANSADDATAIKNAQAALNQATENQKTAQQAMQAARGAVTTNASGAKVDFSDAAKTNQLTDVSARYVSEATRSIVATTLLASFAQEECNRVWDFLDKLPSSEMGNFWRGYDALSQKKAASTTGELRDSKEVSPGEIDTIQSEIIHLAKNCQSNEKELLSQPAMFAPQYTSAAGPDLQVLGGQDGVMLELKQAASFIIIGGVRPYHVSGLTPDLAKELKAIIPPPVDGVVYSLLLERPDGAAKTSGIVKISVADSSNEHVDVAVNFSKPVEKAPDTKSAGTAKITGVTSKNGEIQVTFSPATSVTVKSYTAKATNQEDKSVIQADGAVDAKEIDIPKCTNGAAYAVSLQVTPTIGSVTTVKYEKPPVKCSGSASSPPPASTTLAPPTNVDAKAEAGGKIVVTFQAGVAGGGPAATSYAAAAAPVKTKDKSVKDEAKPIKGSTPDGKVAPITLSGCIAGRDYAVSVVAAAGKTSSKSTSAASQVTCAK